MMSSVNTRDTVHRLLDALLRKDTDQDGNWGYMDFKTEVRDMLNCMDAAEPTVTPDDIKGMAMQLAIDRCRNSPADLFILASSIESFLRGDVVLSKEIPMDLLMRATAYISPMSAVEFSERNFTAALTLIGDMASYLRGE